MLYYALLYGTQLESDVYTQVTGSTPVAEIEESDIILSGQEVPFDCYLDIAELQEWFQDDFPSTIEVPAPAIEQAS